MSNLLKNLVLEAQATWVMWVLIGLSVISLTISLDRLRVFRARRGDLARLVKELHALLADANVDGAMTHLAASRTVEATVVAAGLAHWKRGASSVELAMKAAAGLERARLERGLGLLGTVGSNAPFVGLLGTVIGVVAAFAALSAGNPGASADLLAPEQVMSAIAEALVATALGLAVAIPAVAAFNYFQGLLTSTLANAETLGHVLLTHLNAGRTGDASSATRIALSDHPPLAESALEGA